MREPGGYRVISPGYIMQLVHDECESVAMIAAAAGVSRQFMYRLLRGEKSCRETVAVSIALALDVPTETIFMDRRGRPAHLPIKREEVRA